jgi:hypothetical protein
VELLLLGETGSAQAEVDRLFGELLVIGVRDKGGYRVPPSERADIWLESERLGKLGPRRVEIAAQAQRRRKRQMGGRQLRICGARLSEQIDCLISMPRHQMARAQGPIKDADIRILRIEPDCFLDVRYSRLWLWYIIT